jgi:dTDP-4-dehydrorhamnose reductase
VLINAAAFTNVDLCETQPDQAFRINADGPGVLAKICSDKGTKLIHFSTDYVFDGEKRAPYTEEDAANPISIYGESKLAGEKNVLTAQNRPASRPEGSRLIQPAGSPSSFNSRSSMLDVPSVEGAACRGQVRRHLVVRVSWVFGPGRPSFIDGMIKRAQENEKVNAIADKFSTPTYTHDIAKMLPQFFDRAAEGGILHFANAGKCSWQEYAQWALVCCQQAGVSLRATTVGACKLKDMTNWVARRPVYSVLSTAKYAQLIGTPPRTWRDAVADYIRRFYSKK